MKKIIYTMWVLLLLSCTKNVEESGEIVNIMVNPSKSEMKDYNDISENSTFIQLETTNESLLKYIHKLTINDNRIYAFCSDGDGKLCCFDMQGKFLFTIGTRGNGPSEYVHLTDFAIDDKNKCIWLSDDFNKILKYDLNGKFIQQYKTEFSTKNLIPLQQDDVLAIRLGYYKDKDYSFIIYSISNDEILYYKKGTNSVEKIVASNAFFQEDKYLLYKESFNDTIFKVKESHLEPYYVINFGENSIPKKIIEDKNTKNIIIQFSNPENKYAGLIGTVSENKNYLRFTYFYANVGKMAIYEKNKKENINLSDVSFNGKKLNAAQYFFRFQGNNKQISSLYAYLLTENEKEADNRQQYGSYSDYSALISNLRSEDNPVLILSDIKYDEIFK
jgi:hypothetical protein